MTGTLAPSIVTRASKNILLALCLLGATVAVACGDTGEGPGSSDHGGSTSGATTGTGGAGGGGDPPVTSPPFAEGAPIARALRENMVPTERLWAVRARFTKLTRALPESDEPDQSLLRQELECVGKTELGSGTGGGIIEYGTNVKSPHDSAIMSRIRTEEHESRRLVFEGESDRSEVFPGLRFTLEAHPSFGDLEVLVTGVEHAIEQPAQNSERGTLAYANRFRAVPSTVSYRPPRKTKRPFVPGVRSGIVLAPPEGAPPTYLGSTSRCATAFS